jgi:putative methyltransferase (TIGR04325 family)
VVGARSALRGVVFDAGRLPLVGPVVASAYQRYFNLARARHTRLFHGIFPSFAAAEAAIPRDRENGYDNEASAGRVIDEWLGVYPSDYPVMLWLSKLLPESKLLFDWGGNVALKYFAFARYLDYPKTLTWLVNDVPAVVELGEATAQREGASGLRFTSSLAEMADADVLLAAGVLHFIDDPFGRLRELPRLPQHLVFSKVPAHAAPSAWTLQNMGTAICPYFLFNRDEFVRNVESLGYELIDDWRFNDVFCEVPFFPQYKIDAYSGFYFRRTAAAR